METMLVLAGTILVGSGFAFWGWRIVLSDRYFERWQDGVWHELDGAQWSDHSVFYNRYVRGLGTALAGTAIALFALQRVLAAVL